MVAQKIKEYLANHGIKITWLAEQVGIPVSTLSGILNGVSALKADVFIQICKVLNVAPETFVGHED